MFKKYNLRSYNYALVTLVVITSIFGLLIINSADSSYTVKQAGGIVMALLWMTFLSFVDYHFILKYYRVLYILLVLLLVGVKLFGVSAGGATRWLGSGAFRIQPSEMGKLMLILLWGVAACSGYSTCGSAFTYCFTARSFTDDITVFDNVCCFIYGWFPI